ncbi:unnamed protein product [Parajaminaea phylloscopi]
MCALVRQMEDNGYMPRGPSPLGSDGQDQMTLAAPSQQLSPTRKAVLDRFQRIDMGPPALRQYSTGEIPKPTELSHSTMGPSPLRRALMNSQRGNISPGTVPLGGGSAKRPFKTAAMDSPADVSMSLLNISARGANSSTLEFDIMAAPDDSLLLDARKLGDESFDQRLAQTLSPMAARGPSAARERRSSPAKIGTRADASASRSARPALGMGSPSTSSSQSKLRSFSSASDTSNLFDEEGEESLLFATMKLKAGAGKKLTPGQARMLKALAEGDGPASSPNIRPSAKIQQPDRQQQSHLGMPLPGHARAAPQAAPQGRIQSPSRTTQTRALPNASGSTQRVMPGLGDGKFKVPTAVRSDDAPPNAILSPSGAPASRPPLNAGAARMKRLSGLPQPGVDHARRVGPQTPQRQLPRPQLRTPAMSRVEQPQARAQAAPTSSTTSRTSALVSPRATAARPSLASKFAPSSPRIADRRTQAGQAASTATASAAVHRRTQSQGVVTTTGQLERRGSARGTEARTAVTPQSSRISTGLPGSSSARRPPRPFLLGSGTNHTASGPSSSSAEDRVRSIPTAAATTSGMKQSSSLSQIAGAGSGSSKSSMERPATRIARKSLAAPSAQAIRRAAGGKAVE